MFDKFKMLWCRFHLVAGEQGLVLPTLKSSLFFLDQFKGILRQQVCKYTDKPCGECLLRGDCTYAYLYEEITGASWSLRRFGPLPPPLVWQPPLDKKTDYFPREKIVFNLVLCGRGLSFLKPLVDTVLQLSREGLSGKAGSFQVEQVFLENPFSGEQLDLLEATEENAAHKKVVIQGREIVQWAEDHRELTRLSLRFLTPLLVKEDEAYLQEPLFNVIMKVLFQRTQALYYFYHQQQEVDLDYNAFKEKSARVQKVKDQTRFAPAGQTAKTAQQMPGILGEALYTGDFQELLPFLKLGEFIHLGEQAVYGLGRIQVKTG